MTELADPDRQFALLHAAADRRAALSTLWALDELLGQIVASTTQPMVGQMRLLWWREALESAVSGHPLLADVTSLELLGVVQADLAVIIDGWEELLEPLPLPEEALDRYAAARGAQLFTLSARILGGAARPGAGAGWALADFAARCSDPVTAARAFELAAAKLEPADVRSLPRPLRILTRFAQTDVKRQSRAPRTRWQMLRALA